MGKFWEISPSNGCELNQDPISVSDESEPSTTRLLLEQVRTDDRFAVLANFVTTRDFTDKDATRQCQFDGKGPEGPVGGHQANNVSRDNVDEYDDCTSESDQAGNR